MHWSINGRFLAQPLTGVQRYAREIVLALDRLLQVGGATALDIDLVVPPGTVGTLPLRAIRTVPTRHLRGHAWEQIELPRHVRGGLLSLGNTGPVAVRRQIVCIHDLNTRDYPASYSLAFRVLQRVLPPLLGRSADAIATVSHYSATRLADCGVASQDKIFVAPNGHDHVRRWVPRHSAKTRAAAGPRTIVMIGSPAPHKNVGLVLGLADRLEAAGLRVAVVGQADASVFQATAPVPRSNAILWLGRLDDGEIAALLNDSLCLAFPSLAEGFGLPPLEAMALGCPVVTSDRASLPEICGSAAIYASPLDAEAWLSAFLRIADDDALKTALSQAGRLRATHYSWIASAQIYLTTMQDAG